MSETIKDTFQFALKLLVLLLVIAGAFAYPLYLKSNEIMIEMLILNTIFFFFLTILSFFVIAQTSFKKPGSSLNSFLGSSALKMIIALAYLALFIGDYPDHKLTFVLTFFIAYAICTAFEVFVLLKNLNNLPSTK